MFYKSIQITENENKFKQSQVLNREESSSAFFFNTVEIMLFGSKGTFGKISVNQRVIKRRKALCCFRKRKVVLWLKTPEETLSVITFFYITVFLLVLLTIRYLTTIVTNKVHAKYISQSTLFLKTIRQSFLFKSNLELWQDHRKLSSNHSQ